MSGQHAAKRILDLVAASVGLVLLAPLLLVLAALVWWRMGSPVFFRQQRPGRNGRPFNMYKFRTMREATDAQGNALPDEQRLTKLGQFLRMTSLDELPELYNVLRGQMSLVGPRPLRMEYLDRYTSQQSRRHEVKPGITGWAQINGRNAISWDEKFAMDVWYVDHASMWLDLQILFRTIAAVFRRDGISAADHATMREFMGTRDVVECAAPTKEHSTVASSSLTEYSDPATLAAPTSEPDTHKPSATMP